MFIRELFLILFNSILFVKCWPEFHLYTQKNPNLFEAVDNLNQSVFYIPSTETKFLIHGFGDSGLTTDLLLIKNEILLNENINILVINWEDGASMPNYLNAASNTQVVASKVVEFIRLNNLNPQNLHCIGAHVCGFIGKVLKLSGFLIRRISGLDPAGPIFKGKNSTLRLDKSDAEFVDNIHVDSFFGIQENIGHQDFYPSGGKSQPGCGLSGIIPWKTYELDFIETKIYYKKFAIRNTFDFDTIISEQNFSAKNSLQPRFDPVELVACSHVKVPFYYAESVNSKCLFNAVLCTNYENFESNKCVCSKDIRYQKTGIKSVSKDTDCTSVMGYKAKPNKKNGNYYLQVNRDLPFCRS